MAILASIGSIDAARLSRCDAALAVVEAAQQHKCFERTDGYNSGCPICSALAATPQLTDKGVK